MQVERLCQRCKTANAARGARGSPRGSGAPGRRAPTARPPRRCDSGGSLSPRGCARRRPRNPCASQLRQRAGKRSPSLALPRCAASSYPSYPQGKARLLQRCEQLGDESLERVLRPPRFPPPRPAAHSPRVLQPGALRKSGGARCGGREHSFPAATHRPGPGWPPAPPSAPESRGLLPELLPGLRPPPPLPARLRAAPAALLPVCAGGGGVSQWRESEPVLLQQHPCAAGRVRELCETAPRPGASTVPCRHSGPGPAAAREPLLSLQGRGHRDWEPKSFVCGFVSCLRAAQAEASTRSP